VCKESRPGSQGAANKAWRMRPDRRLVWAMGVIGVASIVWLMVTMGLIVTSLALDQRSLVLAQLLPQLWLIGLTWLLGLVVIGFTVRWLFRRYIGAPARLLEQTQVLLAAQQAVPMRHPGTQETLALTNCEKSLRRRWHRPARASSRKKTAWQP